jgi:hypothetical protein
LRWVNGDEQVRWGGLNGEPPFDIGKRRARLAARWSRCPLALEYDAEGKAIVGENCGIVAARSLSKLASRRPCALREISAR